MEIKVVTVGPEDVNELVLTVGKEYPEITLLSAPYNHELETVDVVKETEHNADIYLFAGTIPYHIAKNYQITDKPMVFIPLSGTALYRTLFKIVTETEFNPIDSPFQFSIDTFNKDEVEECLDELEFNPDELFLSTDQNAEELVQFHYQLWSENKIDIAITCVKSVYEALTDLGVLVYRVIPTKSTIRSSLQKVKLEGKALRNSTTQIAVGILHFNNVFTSTQLADYKTKRKKVALQNLLIDFGEEAQAIFDWSDRDEVRFITTRGAIENVTQKYKKMPLLNEIAMKTDIESSLGVGFGHTANEAEINAREALVKAQLNKLHCFVVDVEGTVYGPIGQETQLQYSLRSDDPYRINLAKLAGLSIATINKLFSFCENFGSKNITAIDLANGLDLTIRSARRILNILERNNLAVIAGEEQPIHRGRPRHLYNILLFEEINQSTGVL
ncbi:transcriptional regulator [Sporosarcina sp. ACRSL]|uniref:transcriptional regulator n=1 Tax=Sporosarcina sp. ACRSL TaxID=2918215 RepID=UPI001EF5EC51|nr:transcriptional regulator [Sporosarcina sp. ACRSL]MCG7342673.1 transcriptional regulator [Sporosarcina sp. ACRSL]